MANKNTESTLSNGCHLERVDSMFLLAMGIQGIYGYTV